MSEIDTRLDRAESNHRGAGCAFFVLAVVVYLMDWMQSDRIDKIEARLDAIPPAPEVSQ